MNQPLGERPCGERGASGAGEHLGSIVRKVRVSQHVQCGLRILIGFLPPRPHELHLTLYIPRGEHARKNFLRRSQRGLAGARYGAPDLSAKPASGIAGGRTQLARTGAQAEA